eukprot:gene25925-31308_t
MEDSSVEESSFRGFDNHTLREVSLYRPLEPLLTRKSKPEKTDSGVVEVGLTEIDEYFDDGFVVGNPCNIYGSQARPLNSRDQWEEVEEKLRALAVKTETSYSRYYGTKLIFHVPVTSTWLLPSSSCTTMVDDEWLFWKGKYYDPKFVYTLHYGGGNATATELLPLCPLRNRRWNSAKASSSTGNSEDDSIVLKCGYYDESYCEKEYLEIDLGSTCHVTKLVTTGCYPTNLKAFPNCQNNRALRGPDKRRMHEKRKGLRRRQVWVVEDTSTLGWVTRYEVFYRNHKGKWQKWSSILDGNVDVASEIVQSVDFTARYVRVVPVDYHVRRAMTMTVFGFGSAESDNNFTEVPVEAKNSNEIVVYELEAPQASKYRPVGAHRSNYDRREKKRERAKRQADIKRDLHYTVQYD